jgi:hypothetical protein
MKKPGRKSRTGNPAAARRGGAPDERPGGWWRWLGREISAFFGLPNWIGELILVVGILVLGGALALWRWLAG